MGDLMAAVCIAEDGGRWDETRELLQWASQCRCCTLPVNLTADDINTHTSKTVRHTHRGGRERAERPHPLSLSVCVCGVGV